jgi:hypothetical protein
LSGDFWDDTLKCVRLPLSELVSIHNFPSTAFLYEPSVDGKQSVTRIRELTDKPQTLVSAPLKLI